MTPEALEALIRDATPDTLATALAGLDESERRKLSKTASSLYSKLRRGEDEPERTGLLGLRKKTPDWQRRSDRWANASMAMVGVCPLSQVKRIDWYRDAEYGAALVKILDDRRPEWADAWIEHRLDQAFPGLRWGTVHTLIERGVCRKPASLGYISLFANGFNGFDHRDKDAYVPLSRKLLDHPSLLADEVWRMFECDHRAFSRDWSENSPHAPKHYETWPDALARLVAGHHLDRDRLLDACLSGLWVTGNTNALSGFTVVHDRVEPTDEELAAREATYRGLLSHRVAHVAGFGLKQLARIDRSAGLDAAALVGALAPLFALKQKSHPMSALRLLKRVAARGDGLTDAGALLLVEAMQHPAADVQELAVGLLEGCADRLDETLVAQLAGRIDEVAALVRPRFEALLGDVVSERDPERDADAAQNLEETRADIEALPSQVRERFGLDAPPDSLLTTLPPPLSNDGFAPGALDALEPLVPIDSVDLLIDAVAHAIEVVDSADEIERIVDGICRLCGQRPEGFAERVAPLVKRIEGSQGSATSKGLAGWGTPPSLRNLVLTWLAGARHVAPLPSYLNLRGPVRFTHARLADLVGRVAAGRAGPLLSAPTHTGGWIAPIVLIERLVALSNAGQSAPETDVIQALLRLSPDGAPDALSRAREVDAPVARVIRYALGDADVSPDPRAAPKTWWVAAARARWPREDLDERLSALGLSVDWPDVLRPATYRWGIREQTTTQFGKSHTRTFVEICVDPPLLGLPEEHPPHGRVLVRRLDESMLGRAGRVLRHTVYRVGRGAKLMGQRILAGRVDLGVAFPTALHHQTGRQWWNNFGTQTPWMVNWLASTWPHNPDGFFARGVTAMVERIDMNDSTLDPTHAYLESLFEPERPWTGMAVLALTVGMASKEADCRRLATDALIEGIEDGRAHPAGLGHTLDGLTDKGWLKVNRVAESLSEVARVSPLHQLVVAQTLETFLATRDEMPRNVHLLLELLNELLAALGRNLPTATRERLQRVKGGSKTAKLAVLLASRTGEEVGRGERAAVALALRTRLERARRMTVRR